MYAAHLKSLALHSVADGENRADDPVDDQANANATDDEAKNATDDEAKNARLSSMAADDVSAQSTRAHEPDANHAARDRDTAHAAVTNIDDPAIHRILHHDDAARFEDGDDLVELANAIPRQTEPSHHSQIEPSHHSQTEPSHHSQSDSPRGEPMTHVYTQSPPKPRPLGHA